MPEINLGRKKKRDKTLSKSRMQNIYQDLRWKELRDEKIKIRPVCERCSIMGITRAVEEVHHRIPFDWGMNDEEVELLAFSIDNLESLCFPCHKIRHGELNKRERAAVMQGVGLRFITGTIKK